MRVLILTDHETHSNSNSLYFIANCLFDHEAISEVTLCSRSLEYNFDFFEGRNLILSCKKMSQQVSFESFDSWIHEGAEKIDNLASFDFVLLRLPRPIHQDFFKFLGQCFNEAKIINRPSGIVKTGSKAYLLNLKEYTAPIELLESFEEILSFSKKFPIVLKPLEDYGGRGILRLDDHKVYLGNSEDLGFDEFENWYADNGQPYLGMKFLKNVKNGDKRIVVANGEVIASSLRLPANDSWLCNIAQGGSSALSEITDDEKVIIQHLDPIMKKEGIFMYGLDTLENDDGKRIISEINTLSVGGIAPVAKLSGKDLGRKYAELFIKFTQSIN